MPGLFRKSSLERLSSPEQLDKAIVVSSPVSWFALAGLTIVIAAVLIWSIFGSLPETVAIEGIVTAPGEAVLYAPYALAGGLSAGMGGQVNDSAKNSGSVHATIAALGKNAATLSEMEEVLGADNLLIERFTAQGAVVTITLRLDENSFSNGALVNALIVTEEAAPIAKLFPLTKERGS